MSIFGGIIVNTTYILFPLTVYLIYSAYTKNLDKKEKSIMLELALYSSLYMLIRYGVMFKTIYPALLFEIPLLVSFIKNKKITSITIALILIIFNHYRFNFNIVMLFIEYFLYFVCYFFFNKKDNRVIKIINSFLVIRIFAMIYQTIFYIIPSSNYFDTFTYIFFSATLLSSFLYLIVFILDLSENIVNYNSALNELNREKEIKKSLFKMTHEVKNPLAVCRGYLDMLDTDADKYSEYIPVISKEINRTLNLMDDFLDYTKIKVSREDTDVCMLLEDVRDEILPLLKSNNIKSEFIIPDDEVYLDLDYNRIKQVFINIYKNSIEAKKKNMKIVLKAYTKNNQLIIKVSDNGIGMSKETLKHIGENFYTTKENGTGLGVSLSQEIISLHDGKMYYKSQLNKGTDVFIELPVK